LVEFEMVCDGIEFVPLGVNPEIPAEAVAVQVNVVDGTFEVKVTAVVVPPEQIVCCIGEFETIGDGFTVIVYSAVGPSQLDGAGP
jgi:hypothetical protein